VKPEDKDKVIAECVRELVRRAQIANEAMGRSIRMYGKSDEDSVRKTAEAETWLEAARHIDQLRSDHPIQSLIRDWAKS
jgi:hypothetical protein